MPRRKKTGSGSGGSRVGKIGKAYSNRTDLNGPKGPLPAAAPTGQAYGKAGEQIAAQKQLPMSAPPSPPPAPSPAPASPGAPPAPVDPGPPPPGLLDPTNRANEPLTSGIDLGAGPGSEILPNPALYGDDPLLEIQALYSKFPNKDMADLLARTRASR